MALPSRMRESWYHWLHVPFAFPPLGDVKYGTYSPQTRAVLPWARALSHRNPDFG